MELKSLKQLVEENGFGIRVKSINDLADAITIDCEIGPKHYKAHDDRNKYYFVLKECDLTNDYYLISES